jgi:probable HAF family extracellular repeat protein
MKATLAYTILAIVFQSLANAQTQFTVTDLGTLYGGNSNAKALNKKGDVVGESDDPITGAYEAFLYKEGKMTGLGVLVSGGFSVAYGVNDSDEVVGASYSKVGGTTVGHAFLYRKGKLQDLTPGDVSSVATAINNIGQVTGFFKGGHAFLYSNGQFQDLATLPTGYNSEGASVNNLGQVAGQANLAFGTVIHAFLYSNGQLQDIGALAPSAENTSVANGINDYGQIVGWSLLVPGTPSLANHAFLYAAGSLRDLGIPGEFNSAVAINNGGQIVGVCSFGIFLYVNGQLYDINKLQNSGSYIGGVAGINDVGEIAANGGPSGGPTHAVLLTPVMKH